ncbi:MAG: hypothetical protein AB7O65_08215 [Candidatus Korobacteraceae bacterium]
MSAAGGFEPLGSFVESFRNGFGRRPQGDEIGPIVLRIADVSSGRVDLSCPRRVAMSDDEVKLYALNAGDLLFIRVNGSRELVGRCIVVPPLSEPLTFNDHLIRVRLRLDCVEPDFIRLVCGLPKTRNFIQENASTSAGQLTINQEALASIRVPKVSLSEQRRIVQRMKEQLQNLDRARAAAEAQLEATEALKTALLKRRFSSGNGWPVRVLGDVSNIVAGITLGRRLNGSTTRRVPYLRVANVKDGHLALDDVYEIDATEDEVRKLALRPGDMLLTEGGDPDKLGRGTFWAGELPLCIHQNHIYRLRFDLGRFDARFVGFQFASNYAKAYFLAHAKQTTGIATINQRVLRSFPLFSPPFEQQKRIAAEIREQLFLAERAKKAVGENNQLLDTLWASLLRRVFHGELA